MVLAGASGILAGKQFSTRGQADHITLGLTRAACYRPTGPIFLFPIGGVQYADYYTSRGYRKDRPSRAINSGRAVPGQPFSGQSIRLNIQTKAKAEAAGAVPLARIAAFEANS